jgi:hypothetical protein
MWEIIFHFTAREKIKLGLTCLLRGRRRVGRIAGASPDEIDGAIWGP